MIYFLFSALALVVIILVWKRAKKPFIHKNISQQSLTKFFEALLFRGHNTGCLFIGIPNETKFLQFSKYIDAQSSVGLRFDFPLADWSRNYYEPLKKALANGGFEFAIKPTGDDRIPEFIVVDLKQNLESALALTLLALRDIFRLNPNELVELYFENVSPKDEKIGFG